MQCEVQTGDLLGVTADLAVLLYAEDETLPSAVAALCEPEDTTGRWQSQTLIYPRGALPARRLLLIGMGKRSAITADTVRQAAALAVRYAQDAKVATFHIGYNGNLPLTPAVFGQAFAEGSVLGAYRYTRYKSDAKEQPTQKAVLQAATDADAAAAGVRRGQIIAQATAFARDLANGPGNDVTPAFLGQTALALGERYGLKTMVLDKAQLIEQGFGGILAVGQGSANEPRFIVMEYGSPDQGPPICLVGKGITFDTGGISIKPAEKMDDMKMDMSGAAAVFGAMQAVAELQLPLYVVGIVCAAENMPSATAYRPGDIIRTLSGKTVEVLNTDAEGRIVLADGLFYAQRYQPAAIVDLATLTGAIMIALGPHAIGMMGNNQELANRLIAAGEATAERVWQLPLWDEYRDAMKSEIADLKNTGGRYGGAITAAGFLAAFVGDYPWAHLDIAGTAWVEKPNRTYQSRGATGVGVRLLVELLQGYVGQQS
ncbi:MAG TPA: leucyl aminopeptidase [Chloroflexus aurantiacus]|jgi:leucyl aminopeptidase|uniref:Probable cytosol aminopeptidase n=1 Tax=Chloroflexus aurantiacus (strain ATCC 29366 / DSM 635 / J-10-fl) TaxID=324602 RepID=A9WJQ9_CHLAA|nr:MULTISPECIES: leucyl aminopeptidase [Chloroflexus]ABY36525.1 Leucyl aminopeptidase [Chloroflexus aurantiacus J-10-fl]RMG53047.1 MAG: leucyl aminopeptidase [Chloroflexota bacterium]GIV94743.1 MAG: putative cytosol aminopeptidase [Chloroflexus sp.]HBW66058.1 leucyl aminopeptidase [Chloroflexus aurantiacus]